MQIVFAVFCLEAEHMALQNVSKFNWDFDQIHRGGWRVMEQQEEVDRILSDMDMELDTEYRDISQKYAARVNKLFQTLRDSIADFRETFSSKRVCDQGYTRPEPLYDDSLTFEILNAREYQTNETDDPIYLAGVDNFLYKTRENLRNLNFSEALPDQGDFERDAHVTPEFVQFVSLTEGRIYELKDWNYSQLVDRFDGIQAEAYPQTTPYFRQFFGSEDDDVLVVIDASSVYGDKLREHIAAVGRTIIGTLNPLARAKVIVAATDVEVSGEHYVQIEESQEYFEAFINQTLPKDFGTYLSQSTVLKIVRGEIGLHQGYQNLSDDAEWQSFRRHFVFVVTGGVVAQKSVRLGRFKFGVPTFFIRFIPGMFKHVSRAKEISKSLSDIIELSDGIEVWASQMESLYSQALQREIPTNRMKTFCTTEIDPVYFMLTDAINRKNQIDD